MPKSETFDREDVLEKVTQTFWDKGFHGTSMQDVVNTTRLNRSSIYNSFGDKFGLFMEAVKRYQKLQLGKIDSLILSGGTPKEAIEQLFYGNIDDKGCFLINCTTELSSSDKNISNLLSDHKETLTGILKSLISEAQEKGEISEEKDPSALALYLFSSLQGFRVTSMLLDDSAKLRALANQILNGL